MKNKNVDFTWVEEVESLIKSPDFCKTITACQELLEEINSLIPSSHMRFLKLNLSLAVDLLKVCQKQVFRLAQLRRRGWFN
jgi:hypothetical protein